MLLIFIVNLVALVAAAILFLVAKAGIRHYMDLYQNEADAKKLSLFTNIALIIVTICITLSCTLMFKESGYNMKNKDTEVENGIRR
jgi:heme/copper-type cytochrome/quinol oxidase subunit 2